MDDSKNPTDRGGHVYTHNFTLKEWVEMEKVALNTSVLNSKPKIYPLNNWVGLSTEVIMAG